MKRTLIFICAYLVSFSITAAPLGDYQFKSPSFNGVGYSSHVLTIENQEATRQKARDATIQYNKDNPNKMKEHSAKMKKIFENPLNLKNLKIRY